MSTIQHVNGVPYFQFEKQMITLVGKKFITISGEAVDGRKVRNALRATNYAQTRGEIVHLKSIMNRYFGGDANGKQYTF